MIKSVEKISNIFSILHQRITRYGILLDPILKMAPQDSKPRLLEVHQQVDGLCRWLNNRVKLSEIDKQIEKITFSHFKVESDIGKAQLSHYAIPKNSFDIFARMPDSKVKDEKRNCLAKMF